MGGTLEVDDPAHQSPLVFLYSYFTSWFSSSGLLLTVLAWGYLHACLHCELSRTTSWSLLTLPWGLD